MFRCFSSLTAEPLSSNEASFISDEDVWNSQEAEGVNIYDNHSHASADTILKQTTRASIEHQRKEVPSAQIITRDNPSKDYSSLAKGHD